jgi:hypothetical protein
MNNESYKYFYLDDEMTACAAWKAQNQNYALQLFLETLDTLDMNVSNAGMPQG